MNAHPNHLGYLLLAALLIFSSCKDDEDPSRRDMLIGTWEIQSGELFDYRLTVSGVELDRQAVQGLAAINPDLAAADQALAEGADVLFPSGTTITFRGDNSYTLDDQTEILNGTWSLSDDEDTITVQTSNTTGPNELNFIIESLTDQQIGILLVLDQDDINLANQGIEELPAEIEGFIIEYKFSFLKQ